MRIRTLMISLLAVCAVFAVSAIGATAASAECLKVVETGKGTFENNACTVADKTNEYIKAKTVTQINSGEWCAKVETAKTGKYSNTACTEEKTGATEKEYIKVMAACYPVAEPKTGRYATSEKCEKKEVSAPAEWINISKLEKEIKPGVWCAKVETAKTGKYSNAACTEEKTGATEKEYITVLVSLDQWEVCERGGTEEFETHKCAKKSPGGEWSWKVLEAGRNYNIVSNNVTGVSSVLTVGTKVITCTGETNKGTITELGKGEATEIKFTGCTTATTGCAVHSPTQPNGTIVLTKIPTKLEQRLVGEEAILVDNFEQNMTTKEFVTLEFSGTSCAAAGYVTTKVKGNVGAEVKNLANGEVEVNFPSPELPGNMLEEFGAKALFASRDELSLENGWALRAR